MRGKLIDDLLDDESNTICKLKFGMNLIPSALGIISQESPPYLNIKFKEWFGEQDDNKDDEYLLVQNKNNMMNSFVQKYDMLSINNFYDL